MVERQLVARDVRDQTVLQAMREVPREAFMPADLAERRCRSPKARRSLEPFIVALMAEALAALGLSG